MAELVEMEQPEVVSLNPLSLSLLCTLIIRTNLITAMRNTHILSHFVRTVSRYRTWKTGFRVGRLPKGRRRRRKGLATISFSPLCNTLITIQANFF